LHLPTEEDAELRFLHQALRLALAGAKQQRQ
jgi:hypothetical protein